MTVVSNDPSWWPIISSNIFFSYWIVVASVVVVYDWVLTLGQEIELIWRQRWSLMTVLYLVVHTLYWNAILCYRRSAKYAIGLPDRCRVSEILNIEVQHDDPNRCNFIYYAASWTNVVAAAMLGVIIIARLHAMYQRSRMMLIFLVIIFMAVNIACGVLAAIGLKHSVGEELILSGTHICNYEYEGDVQLLNSIVWVLNTVWEVLALCLSVRIAVKHFRDLRQLGPSTGSTIWDCFGVLIKSHALYFASFVCVSCFDLGYLSPELENPYSMGAEILNGALQILFGVQIFVLGPRLILSVREYHAKLVADSEAEISMNSIVFQEHVHVPTSSTV
ncbi:hypothetical protein BDR03DRAFT_1095619 [Suillus americanus]|nr:hypothetical protein BDR03DRAFT_1095619 [Suillus americanus]